MVTKSMAKSCKFRVKSSGAGMFAFSWEGLALGVDLCDFYKLGASLPASLAGACFPEKKPVLFYICKTCCFRFLGGRSLNINFEATPKNVNQEQRAPGPECLLFPGKALLLGQICMIFAS